MIVPPQACGGGRDYHGQAVIRMHPSAVNSFLGHLYLERMDRALI